MFEIGDKVRVVREAVHGRAYENIGKIGEVIGKNLTMFLVCCDGTDANAWWYSLEALEKCTDVEGSEGRVGVVRSRGIGDGFKVGNRVRVMTKVPDLQHTWVQSMDRTIGRSGEVTATDGGYTCVRVVGLGTWTYRDTALKLVTESCINVGDSVRVIRKSEHPHADWHPDMDTTIGTCGIVDQLNVDYDRTYDLIRVKFPTGASWWYCDDVLEKCTDVECLAQDAKVDFKIGDTVCVVDRPGHREGWVPRLAETIGCTGQVVDIDVARGARVVFDSGPQWWYSAKDLRKVAEPGVADIGVGDVVQVMLKHNSPRGTRGWVSAMDATIGREGRVQKVDGHSVKVVMDDNEGWWYLREDLRQVFKGHANRNIGDSVIVARKVISSKHPWVSLMDETVGCRGVVAGLDESHTRVHLHDGMTWWYDNSALQGVPETGSTKREFRPGDLVRIVGKCEHQRDWIPDMDRTIGQYGTVFIANPPLDSDGNRYKVEFPTGMSFWYNVEALQLAEQSVAKTSLPVKSLSCPCVEWLGVWLTPDREIREVVWDEFVWRVYERDEDRGERKHCDASPDWRPPDNWTRLVNGSRLSRPKPRSRISIGWDPMDEG